MVVGEINTIKEENGITKHSIDYEFVKLDETEFKKIKIDISKIDSLTKLIEQLELGKDIYKIELFGVRNFDTSNVYEELKVINSNVCEVEDFSHFEYDLDNISKEDTLKGLFTKKILEKIEENPEEKEKLLGALEYVYNLMG